MELCELFSWMCARLLFSHRFKLSENGFDNVNQALALSLICNKLFYVSVTLYDCHCDLFITVRPTWDSHNTQLTMEVTLESHELILSHM